MAETLYERLGEQEGIRDVVEEFYARLVTDEQLGPFFVDAPLERLKQRQTTYLCDATGGPETDTGISVREAHLHLPFEPAHIQRALDLLAETLRAHGIAEPDINRVIETIACLEDDLLARQQPRPQGSGLVPAPNGACQWTPVLTE